MNETLAAAKLADCDLLLYRGRTWLGRAIRLFDGAEVNHAGIYVRTARGAGAVAEATGKGVVRRPLSTSVAKNEWVLCRRLRSQPRSLAPVRALADRIVTDGHRYAYEQIVLLAFLCLARRLPWGPGLEGVVRGALDTAAAWLAGLVPAAREPMICSEFAFRCYDGARRGRGDAYTIVLRPRGDQGPARRALRPRIDSESLIAQVARSPRSTRRAARPKTVRAAAPSAATLRARFEAYEAALRRPRSIGGTLRLDAPIAASIERFAIAWANAEAARAVQPKRQRARTPMTRLTEVAADFVTPGDLLHSASLFTVGQVSLGASRTARAKPALRARRTVQRATWTRADVEREIVAILASLAPGWKKSDIALTTRLAQDFGFDDWGVLRVVPPIRRRLQVDLADGLVRRARTVGDLVKLVWEQLKEAP